MSRKEQQRIDSSSLGNRDQDAEESMSALRLSRVGCSRRWIAVLASRQMSSEERLLRSVYLINEDSLWDQNILGKFSSNMIAAR